MSQTRPNKIVTITNDEVYDLATHQARMADSTNVIVPVNTLSERDGLAAQYPGGVLPNPYYVARKDLPGQPIETWDGDAWKRVTEESISWSSLGAWTSPNGIISRRWNGSKWVVTFIGHLVLSTNSPFGLTTAMSSIGNAVPSGWRPAPGDAYGGGAYSNNTPTYQGPIVARIGTDGVLQVAAVNGTLNVVQNCQFFINISWTY